MRLVPVLVIASLVLSACADGRSEKEAEPAPPASTPAEPAPGDPTSGEPRPLTAAEQRALDQQLVAAARDHDVTRVERLVVRGADVEARDEHERTPLLIAVTDDEVELARILLEAGASPDALDDRHDTPWLVTGVTGSVPMADLLLGYDPDLTIRNRYGGVSIIPASERGHVAYVRRVARTAIDVNHVNDLGWTALLEAVILGDGSDSYQEIVRILLAAGADPTIADHDGVDALQHARTTGQDEVAAILVGRR